MEIDKLTEEMMQKAVVASGGQIFTDYLSAAHNIVNPDFRNPDFIYHTPEGQVILAELKVITEDIDEARFQLKLQELVEDWIERGLHPPFWGTCQLNSDKLHPHCRNELFEMMRVPIRRRIKDAAEQIRKTKARLNLNSARGMLLLCNAAMSFHELDSVVFQLHQTLAKECPEIDTIAYFTMNMPATMPGQDRDILVWLSGARRNWLDTEHAVHQKLQSAWVSVYQATTGIFTPVYNLNNESEFEKIKYLPKVRVGAYYADDKNVARKLLTYGKNHASWLIFHASTQFGLTAETKTTPFDAIRAYKMISDNEITSHFDQIVKKTVKECHKKLKTGEFYFDAHKNPYRLLWLGKNAATYLVFSKADDPELKVGIEYKHILYCFNFEPIDSQNEHHRLGKVYLVLLPHLKSDKRNQNYFPAGFDIQTLG